ncbi:MAG: MBL fold metallo-hydrolase [Verrucomicrobiae bacterium]|nr:MBL fold metallo-hydrolase [Verrucomicrobiae bacterium]
MATPRLLAAEAVREILPGKGGNVTLYPIEHATLVLQAGDHTVYVDPVGGAARFQDLPDATLILITHIHGDHLNIGTLQAVSGERTPIVAPPSVVEKLADSLKVHTTPLSAGEQATVTGVLLEAIPAYNTPPERLGYHPKDRGDVGYVLTLAGQHIYVSGDTEDIPEMRSLKNIDVAFLCMNLPYTMTVEQAAAAVRAFRPKRVYPYHYRGSDLEKFKERVGTDGGVDVRLLDWYRK